MSSHLRTHLNILNAPLCHRPPHSPLKWRAPGVRCTFTRTSELWRFLFVFVWLKLCLLSLNSWALILLLLHLRRHFNAIVLLVAFLSYRHFKVDGKTEQKSWLEIRLLVFLSDFHDELRIERPNIWFLRLAAKKRAIISLRRWSNSSSSYCCNDSKNW